MIITLFMVFQQCMHVVVFNKVSSVTKRGMRCLCFDSRGLFTQTMSQFPFQIVLMNCIFQVCCRDLDHKRGVNYIHFR